MQADTQRIVEVYHRNGRFDVTVEPQIIERPNNRVDLVFVVKEGEKTGVKSIDFVGNKSYSSWRLKEVIKTAQSNFLSFLQTTDVYDPDRMEADRDLIRRFYLKHGFADVQVVSAVAEYDPAKKGFNITFTIEEGPLYHFGTADVQSNVRAIDSQSLQRVLRMRSGDIYNGEAIEKTVEDVTIEVARRGYPFATVRPRGDRNPQTRTINQRSAMAVNARRPASPERLSSLLPLPRRSAKSTPGWPGHRLHGIAAIHADFFRRPKQQPHARRGHDHAACAHNDQKSSSLSVHQHHADRGRQKIHHRKNHVAPVRTQIAQSALQQNARVVPDDGVNARGLLKARMTHASRKGIQILAPQQRIANPSPLRLPPRAPSLPSLRF